MQALRAQHITTAALDLGPSRHIRRVECDSVPSGFAYARKVISYLFRGYRIHTHLNGESTKAYLLALYSTILSWLFRRPTVLTWHGGLGYRWFPVTNNRVVDLVHKTIFRLSEWIICNDETIKTHIVACGASPEKVVSIPAFSKQYLEFKKTDLPVEVETFIATHDPTLFCYAYYRQEFYLPQLLDATALLLKSHPRLGLVLVGYTAGYTPIRDRAQALGIDQNVCFVGDLGHDEFLTTLVRSDIYVRTHRRDGVSSSVLEALALGVPVVAADNPMRPTQVITYEPEDVADLVQSVEKVLTLSPDERRPPAPEISDTVAKEVAILVGMTDTG